MPRYEIRPRQQTLIDGVTVGPDDVMAVVACDLPVRDVLSMVNYGGATLAEIDVPGAAAKSAKQKPAEESSEEPEAATFTGVSQKVLDALAAVGVTTLAQGAIYLRDNGSFEPLDHIGEKTAQKLVEQITAAGFPVE